MSGVREIGLEFLECVEGMNDRVGVFGVCRSNESSGWSFWSVADCSVYRLLAPLTISAIFAKIFC